MSKKKCKEDIIENGNIIHSGKYDYSLVENINGINEKLPIICHCKDEDGVEHGVFYQSYAKHISRKHGCPKCCKNGVKYTEDDFNKRIYKIWGDKYIVSDKTPYVNAHTKICFICKEHGEFITKPYYILQGHGCPKCGNEKTSKKLSMDLETFLLKAKEIHGEKYDYSKVEYDDYETEICIVCKKHGEFYQKPHAHLTDRGCPVCKFSHLERQMAKFLNDNKITYLPQQQFKWIGKQKIDFYLPEYNVGIECQGRQHYVPSNFGSKTFSPHEMFLYVCKQDEKKLMLCKENGVDILYYTNYNFPNEEIPQNTFTNLDLLKEKIFTYVRKE